MPTNKYFACPFCKERFTREDLVVHIDRKHNEELPEGFTPLRAAFHAVNRKDFKYNRPCRICKKPTPWNEDKGRYDFLCSNPTCKSAWITNMKNTMGEKYGAYRPTTTAEGLEKMLAGRKISGVYKFTTGGEVPYTGSYEKKCLEFMDKAMGIKFEDVEVPGPAIKYPYKGQDHIYIPDVYYKPYNLLIEVKDGGSNPNKHPGYSEVRAKKIAKENYVIKHTDYNYLRLTDNDFSQLFGVFADLKLHLNNDDKSRVIHVHESGLYEHMGVAAMNPIVGFISGKDTVITHNPSRQTFGVADSPRFEKVITLDARNHLGLQDKHDFGEDGEIKTYIKKDNHKEIADALKKFMDNDEEVSESAFYEVLFGHPMYTKDQILFEDVIDYDKYMASIDNMVIESTIASIFGDADDPDYVSEGFDEFKSTFLNEEDVKYNYDAFAAGNSDILFISGPETFGKAADFTNIAQQFGADIIHLDDVQKHYLYSDKKLKQKHDLIYKYFCDSVEGVEERKKKKKDPEVNLYETVPHFLSFFLESKYPNKRYIVEGHQILDLLAANRIKFEMFKPYSVLLKGSSYLQTQIQTMKSDSNTDTEEDAFKLMKNYIDAISNRVKNLTHDNFSKSLKKKEDIADKDVSDVIKDAMTESTIFNEKDIYYNKDKFDSGEINLCFITGISGSGKSSMARNMSNSNIEMTELDDVVWNKMNYSMDNLKEYGELIYSFFNGPGKKYYYTEDDVKNGLAKPVGDNYEELLIHDFIDYAKRYAASHKDKKFIVEGVWLVDFVDPASIKDYAVYIKGTSLLVSRWRSAKRDSQDAPEGKKLQSRAKNFFSKNLWNSNKDFEKDLTKFRNYFKNLESIKESVEDVMIESNFLEPTDSRFNLETWNTEENNILFITGVSGAGKTALSEDLKKLYECEIVCLDNISSYYMTKSNYGNNRKNEYNTVQSNCPAAVAFLDEFTVEEVGIRNQYKETMDIQKHFCDWFIENFYDDGKLYVIESNYIPFLYDLDWYADKPIIVKEMGYRDTVIRRLGRMYSKSKQVITEKAIEDNMKNPAYKKNFEEFVSFSRNLNDRINELNEAEEGFPVISKPYFIKAKDNSINACVTIDGYDKPFRGRSSMLILKYEDGDWKVFLSKDNEKNHEYHAPGGGWNQGEDPKDAAIREAQEECYMNVDNVKRMGFLMEVHDKVADWVKENVSDPKDWWYNYYSEIYVGTYESKFNGEVRDEDKDQIANSGKWYNFEEIKEDLTPKEYAEAIEDYINDMDIPTNEFSVNNVFYSDIPVSVDDDVFYCVEDDTTDLTGDIPLFEVSEEDLKKNMSLSPVFVMLSFNGSTVGKVIKGYGKDLGWQYSHSSISLVPSLSTLYSFNITKSTDEEGVKHKYNGLAIEHFRDFRNNPKCKIKVIAILVDTETKSKIRDSIQYYVDNISKTKYATKSLGKALLGTGGKVQNYGNMTLFCSQFVDSILKQANIDIAGKGSSINVHPSELGQFKDRNNYFTVYEGKASEYNEDTVEQKINYMKATMDHKDLNAISDKTAQTPLRTTGVENRLKSFVKRKINNAKEKRNNKADPLHGAVAAEGGT